MHAMYKRIAITLYKMMQRILPAAQTKDIA
jgi:hypothetical protein